MYRVVKYPSGTINFEATILAFAKEMEMSFGDAMRYLVTSDSARMAAEFLGIENASRDTLNELARFFDSKGYTVRWLVKAQNSTDTSRKPDKTSNSKQRKPKEAKSVVDQKFNLTKVDYLMKRAGGKNRNQIAKEVGIALQTLYYHLKKWGIKDPIVEEAEIERLTRKPIESSSDKPAAPASTPAEDSAAEGESVTASAPESSAPTGILKPAAEQAVKETAEKIADAIQKHVEVGYITVRIPVPELHHSFDVEPTSKQKRHFIFRKGFEFIEHAMATTYHELHDLVGPEEAARLLQEYVDKRFFDHAAGTPVTEEDSHESTAVV